MEFQRKKVATALGYALGVGGALSLLPGLVIAQDIRVDVTGSNIKRVEGEGGLPVQTITRQDIERTGVQTSAELLTRITSNQSSGNYNDSQGIGNNLNGFAGASLRGLGFQRTLVLLNGRRVANFASAGTGVDVNSIPLAAVERVEILRDGASAIYGTDAVGGVINFILRRDFRGAELYGYYGDSEQGGGETFRGNVAGGYGDLSTQRFNVFGWFDFVDQKNLAANQRPFSRTAFLPADGVDRTSANSFPANVATPAGTRNPANPACIPPLSFPTTRSPRQCRFDFAATIDIQPPSEKLNTGGQFVWQFLPDHQLFLEGSYSKNKFDYIISPTPVSSAITPNGEPIDLPPTSPFYPAAFAAANGLAGKPLSVSYRTFELGGRATSAENEQTRGVVGVRGVFRTWDYQASFNYNENEARSDFTGGTLSTALFVPAFATGLINPFGPNNAAGLALLRSTQVFGNEYVNTAKVKQFEFKTSNEIYKLPAGPLSIAFGGEYREEELQQINSPVSNSGDIVGGSGMIPSVFGDRDVYAFFAEANIPIVKNVEVQLAVRYDDYSDFGETTNPKVAIRWQPSNQLLLRASYGKGFRAPGLDDLFTPPGRTNTGDSYDDPLRCPITNSAFDCNLQLDRIFGGNRNLKPERSEQYSAGIVWEPNNIVSIGVDYFFIKVEDTIGVIGDQTIFTDPRYISLITRRPPDAQFPTLPGRIDAIVDTLQNIGKIETSGIDIDVAARFPSQPWGQVTARFNATYTIKYDFTDALGIKHEVVGDRDPVVADTGVISRWKYYLNLDYNRGPWGVTVAQNYQHHYLEPDISPGATREFRTVGTYSVWDLSGRYTGFKNTTLTLGVRNLFDRDPPFTSQGATFQVGYDRTYADPLGRFYYGSVRYAFK
ncbi:MAG: TonB-dependent receptor [Casimicrobiaceae bacterium]